MSVSATAKRAMASRCLGAAYNLARCGKRDLAVASLRAALADDDLRTELEKRRSEYAALVSDNGRSCHIERTVHDLMVDAFS